MIARTLFIESKKLRVFDMDDTLIKTDSYIYVNHESGNISKLTPGQYAVYKPRKGDEFDFREFDTIKNPTEIKAITRILKDMVRARGNRGVYILTARSKAKPISIYLKDIGIRDVEVVALGSADPQHKADWIEEKIKKDGYDDVFFIDDSIENVKAAKRRLSKLGVKHRVSRMKHSWSNAECKRSF